MLSLLALLGGCGGLELTTTAGSPTPVADRTPTTMSSAFLEAVLLSRLDIRNSAEEPEKAEEEEAKADAENTPAAQAAVDTAVACLADLRKEEAGYVEGPTLLSGEGLIQRSYTSMGTQASPETVKAKVAELASPANAQCFVDFFKRAISAGAGTRSIDASGISASAAPVAIGEGGGLITVAGNVTIPGYQIPIAFELLSFSKGRALIIVLSSAMPGGPYPVRIEELARRIEGRLL